MMFIDVMLKFVNSKMREFTASANRGSNIQCSFPTVLNSVPRHCQRLAIIGQGRFGTVPSTLPLGPDCLYGLYVLVF